MKFEINWKISKRVRDTLYFLSIFYWMYWFLYCAFGHHIVLALLSLLFLIDSIYETFKGVIKKWFKKEKNHENKGSI